MYFSVSSGQQGASHNYFCLYKWNKHPLGGKSFFLITILYVIQTVVVQKALDNWISHWAPFKSLSYWKHLDSEKCNHLNLIILQILIGKQMEIQCNDSICVHLQQWSGQKYTWIWLNYFIFSWIWHCCFSFTSFTLFKKCWALNASHFKHYISRQPLWWGGR